MLRRNTNQRQIVYDAIKMLGHASTEELIDYINTNYIGVSLATIYRNLGILIEDDMIRKVKFNDVDVYETIKRKHYHFICRHCNKIIDVIPDETGLGIENLKSIEGNTIDECEVVFYGTCADCKNKTTVF